LLFSTTADGASSPTERMKITNSGQLINFCTGEAAIIRTTQNGSSDSSFIVATGATSISNGTTVTRIRSDGDLENANNSYTGFSDIKLKENIVDAGSQWTDIKSLQVRKYNFKAETNLSTHTQIGLVAQELELTCPGLVKEVTDRDNDGNDLGTTTKSVNYSVLYMKAVKALQEAMDRIEILETKVAALEAG